MSDTGHTELLPCPFCGGEPVLCRGGLGSSNSFSIECEHCGVQTSDGNIERVSAAWNRRASPSLPLLVEALEAFADPKNWVVNGRFDPHSGNFDATSFARAALASIKGGG